MQTPRFSDDVCFGRVVDVTGAAGALVPAHRPGRAWRAMKASVKKDGDEPPIPESFAEKPIARYEEQIDDHDKPIHFLILGVRRMKTRGGHAISRPQEHPYAQKSLNLHDGKGHGAEDCVKTTIAPNPTR